MGNDEAFRFIARWGIHIHWEPANNKVVLTYMFNNAAPLEVAESTSKLTKEQALCNACNVMKKLLLKIIS